MFKFALRHGAAVAALALAAQPALAAPVAVNAAVATAQSPLTFHEYTFFNAAQTATSHSGVSVNSGVAQTAVITNNSTLLTPGSNYTVHYAISESALTSDNYTLWKSATNAVGASKAGNLLQIPFLGTAVPIVVVNSAITANGALKLNDDQLCGIFSGKITDWSQLTVPTGGTTPKAGPITVVYRNDTGGTTYNLTNHLSKVCNAANSNFLLPIVPNQLFAALFAGGTVPGAPARFVGVKGNSGVVNYMSGLAGTTVTSAISYTSPDYTSIAPAPDGKLSNGQPSALLVAALLNGGTYYTPTTANISLALANPGPNATNATPPASAAAAAISTNWAPSIPTPSKGYPIVAYSVVLLPQCIANKTVAKGIKAFLSAHYNSAQYATQQLNNGLVRVSNAGSGKIYKSLKANLLANANGWNVNFANATACTGLTGR